MPPPANQGSRAALVTWTVITSILFVTSLVFAIYFYVDSNKIRETAANNAGKYAEVVDEAGLAGPDVISLRAARTGAPDAAIPGLNPSMKLLDVAIAQRNNLADLITGTQTGDVDKAAKAATVAKTAVLQAAAAVKYGGGTSSGNTLADAMTALDTTLAARQAEVAALNANLTAAKDARQKTVDDTTAQLDAMNKTIEGIRAEQAKAVGDVSTLGSSKDDQIKNLQAQTDQALKDAQEAQLKLQTQVNDANRKAKDLALQISKMEDRLGARRIDPTKPILQQPDGHLVRLPGGNICFIDIGAGDQVSPGLTFEVYDKIDGIPQPGDPNTDDNLPRGKASLEVTHVGATSSECRITRMTPGSALSEGDLIVNIVYDKNTKYKFLVFGNFDIARTNKPGPQDGEILKRLITQWGGEVTNDVNVNTDFVVLGAEPVIPTYTKEELQDPVNKAKFDQATADAGAYDDIKGKAKDLRIPVLNQNRFLYFVGYYDQARR